MTLVNRLRTGLQEKAALENAVANSEKNEAMIEYLAMMLDIDLSDDDNTGVGGEE